MTRLVPDRQTRGEIVRFVLVGVKSNMLYVVLYVGLTSLGLDHRISLTIVYLFGILYMFVFNKYYVFKQKDGAHFPQFFRYVLTYAGIWAMNIAIIQVLNVHFRVDPYLVQTLFVAVMIVVVFVFNKYFIFGRNRNVATRTTSAD
jgi:putative flippase GtrA